MKVLAANWKMNHLRKDVAPFLQALKDGEKKWKSSRVVLFPPSVLIPEVQAQAKALGFLDSSKFSFGPQNIHGEEKGAFTGELSPAHARDFGCEWALVGHSERRQFFGESSEGAVARARGALRNGLETMLCVGETLAERESGRIREVLNSQLSPLSSLEVPLRSKLWLAYEPVWAIGTGKNATLGEAEEAHRLIKKEVAALWGGECPPILYGGSVKAENAAEFLKSPEVAGVLVGGASLTAASFLAIAASLEG